MVNPFEFAYQYVVYPWNNLMQDIFMWSMERQIGKPKSKLILARLANGAIFPTLVTEYLLHGSLNWESSRKNQSIFWKKH